MNKTFGAFLYLALSGLFTTQAQAFSFVGESAEIMNQNYAAGVGPQFKFSGGGGTNVSVWGDLRLSDELSTRALVETGDTDFYASGSLKYIPFPDLETQPAVGGKITLGVINDNGGSGTVLRIEPLVSKKFQVEQWTLTPYGSLPVTWIAGFKGRGQSAIQIVAGSEVGQNSWKDWSLGAELGLQAKDSETYGLVYFKYLFDQVPLKKK